MSQHQAHGCSTEHTVCFLGCAARRAKTRGFCGVVETRLSTDEAPPEGVRDVSERHKSDHKTALETFS